MSNYRVRVTFPGWNVATLAESFSHAGAAEMAETIRQRVASDVSVDVTEDLVVSSEQGALTPPRSENER